MKRTSQCVAVAGFLFLAGCSTIDDLGDDLGIGEIGKAPETRQTLIGTPKVGRCHMESCSWFRVDDLAMIRETPDDTLLRAHVRWGSSDRPDGDPLAADPRDVVIAWPTEPNVVYVYCTTRLPALIEREEDSSWQATRIDLVNTAGALESSAALYTAICHPGEDRRGPDFARHGYRSIEDDTFFIPLRQPDDILTHGR